MLTCKHDPCNALALSLILETDSLLQDEREYNPFHATWTLHVCKETRNVIDDFKVKKSHFRHTI